MDTLLNIVQTILGLGATVILPIMIAMVGLFFGMKLRDAIVAGMTVGIGFAGLNLVIGLLYEAIGPAQAYYETLGTGFNVVEIPWPMMGGAAWATPFAPLVVPVGVLLNLLIYKFTKNGVINVDIWNYIHFLIPATMAWYLFDSVLVGFLLAVGLSVIALIFAKLNAKDWQDYFGLQGTTCSTLWFCSFQWPIFKAFEWLFDRIPVLNKIDIRVGEDTRGSKWGAILGSPIFIGLFVGTLLGVLTKQSYDVVLMMATMMAAVMFLMPRMVGVLMEGLASVGNSVRAFIKKRTSGEEEKEVLIGMDVALGLGDPTAITVSILMIPVIIGLAFVFPWVSFFPLGVIAGIPYTAVFAAMGAKGNLFRAMVYSTLMVIGILACGTLLQPQWMGALQKAGADISGAATYSSFDPYVIIPVLIKNLFGG